jgi:hypothetical protein
LTTKPFAKLDIHLHSNERILPLSHAAFRLYITSITLSREVQSAGHIGQAQALQLADGQRVNHRAIKELLDSGRWEQNGTGYIVHDFEEWQIVDADLHEKRVSAGSKGGKQKASNAVASAKQTPLAKPSPPSVEEEAEGDTEAPIGALLPVVPPLEIIHPRPKITPAKLVMLAYAIARKEQFHSSTPWTPTEKREERARHWLKTFPLNDLIDAAVGWRRDSFSLGDNTRNTRYCDFELIFRDEAHIEKFRDLERDAHMAETAFVDEEPEWQKKRREILERELREQDG